jgi:hypothetical protein
MIIKFFVSMAYKYNYFFQRRRLTLGKSRTYNPLTEGLGRTVSANGLMEIQDVIGAPSCRHP